MSGENKNGRRRLLASLTSLLSIRYTSPIYEGNFFTNYLEIHFAGKMNGAATKYRKKRGRRMDKKPHLKKAPPSLSLPYSIDMWKKHTQHELPRKWGEEGKESLLHNIRINFWREKGGKLLGGALFLPAKEEEEGGILQQLVRLPPPISQTINNFSQSPFRFPQK